MIKTRFAPSPTGYLHVGGLRTALYCYLFAKAAKGKFALRIEDTDRERFVEGAIENLLNTLKWVGLEFDEGPIIQSERFDTYRKYADELVAKGHAYYCFCTKDRLDTLRKFQEENKQAPMYDRKCATIPLEEAKKRIEAGEPYVIRQKIPYENLKFKDLIRGTVVFDGKMIDDQVLIKSDGFPTYHLANVVDDHLMEITHVIRGEEWLPSTPKHIFLYQAFGWTPPEFAHIPLLLNQDRTKLSKRQGDVSVEDYIKKGYLREAIINFVAFLGWHPGAGEENEILSLKELEEKFSIERVHKAGAIFDLEKLNWFNWQWQKRILNEDLAKTAKEIDKKVEIKEEKKGVFSYKFSSTEDTEKFRQARAKKLLAIAEKHIDKKYTENTDLVGKALIANEEKILREPNNINQNIYYFFEIKKYDSSLLTNEKMNVDTAQAKASIQAATEELRKITEKDWTEENLKNILIALVQKLNIKNGQLLWPIRAALTGEGFSPGAFEMLWALGKNESIKRLEFALNQ